jgi:hypothetical protein
MCMLGAGYEGNLKAEKSVRVSLNEGETALEKGETKASI